MASGDTKTESYLRAAAEGTRADLPADSCCNTKTQNLILGVANRIMDVEDEVEEIKNNPDVVDIVDTYADLQAYDTQHLTDNDIIRVLQDETHDNNSTYYRFTKNPDTWTFIGEISGGSSVNVVQTIGNSTTDVMSQNAVLGMMVADTSSTIPYDRIQIGGGVSRTEAVSVGRNSLATAYSVSVGKGAGVGSSSSATYNTDIGYLAGENKGNAVEHSVSLGSHSKATRAGEVNVGTGRNNYGYNSTSYRVIGGVHDPVDAHDAATKGYVDAQAGGSLIKKLTTADFNWNTTTSSATEPYDCVALWLLEPGIYDTSGLTQVTQWRFHKDWDGSGNDGGVRIVLKVPKAFSNSTNVLIGVSGQGTFSRISKLFEWDVYDNGTKSIDTVITYSMI